MKMLRRRPESRREQNWRVTRLHAGRRVPFKGNCRLLLQLDSCSVPFDVNFGDAGVGYAFLNEVGDQAKFLWQWGKADFDGAAGSVVTLETKRTLNETHLNA
jgi:hypothetical protein